MQKFLISACFLLFLTSNGADILRNTSSVKSSDPLKELQCQVNEEIKRRRVKLKTTFGTPYCFEPLACEHVSLNISHLFGINLNTSLAGNLIIEGFHHDSGKRIENQKIIGVSILEKNKNGMYKAKLLYNNKELGDKSFFPAEWPRGRVVRCVREAYDDYLKQNTTPIKIHNEQFKIQGNTSEGFPIMMHVNQKGSIISAYPAQI